MIEEIKYELSAQGYSLPPDIEISGKLITFEEFIEASLPNNSGKEIASILGVTYTSLNAHISRHYRPIFKDKPTGTLSWARYFVSKLDLLICTRCVHYKELSDFSHCKGKFLGKSSICKSCASTYNKSYYKDNIESSNARSASHYINNKASYIERSARRRAIKLQATPSWADFNAIKQKYSTCPAGWHVDHEIPLVHPLVCGLHVDNNLQHLTAKENLEKSNSFTIT